MARILGAGSVLEAVFFIDCRVAVPWNREANFMARILPRLGAVVLYKKEATSTLTAILDLNVTTDKYRVFHVKVSESKPIFG